MRCMNLIFVMWCDAKRIEKLKFSSTSRKVFFFLSPFDEKMRWQKKCANKMWRVCSSGADWKWLPWKKFTGDSSLSSGMLCLQLYRSSSMLVCTARIDSWAWRNNKKKKPRAREKEKYFVCTKMSSIQSSARAHEQTLAIARHLFINETISPLLYLWLFLSSMKFKFENGKKKWEKKTKFRFSVRMGKCIVDDDPSSNLSTVNRIFIETRECN